MEMEENEKKIVEGLTKSPKEIQIYLMQLFRELNQCYEYVSKKEEFQLFMENIRAKKCLYGRLANLMHNEIYMKPMADRINKAALKRKKAK